MEPNPRRRTEIWIGLALSALAVLAANWLLEGLNSDFETRAFHAVVAARQPTLTDAMQFFTTVGDTKFLMAVAAVPLLLGWPTRHLADRLAPLAALVLAGGANLLLKTWFHRPRPGVDFNPLVEEPTFSFPSGHTLTSLALYGFLSYLLMYSPLSRGRRWVLFASLWLLVLMVGVSRIYLGAHYPGDVAGGVAAGIPVLALAILLHRAARER